MRKVTTDILTHERNTPGAQMNDGITLYTTQTCGPCRRLKRGLHEAGVDFREVDVNVAPDMAHRIEQATGGYRIVPSVVVGERLLVNPRVEEVLDLVAAN